MAQPGPRSIRWGMVYFNVSHWPVRLVSSDPRQSSLGISHDCWYFARMPALAMTKSSPPECRHALLHRLLDLCLVAHVAGEGERGGPGGLHQPQRLGQVVRRGHAGRWVGAFAVGDIEQGDACSLPGQGHCVAAPLTPGGAGDQHDLSVELTHVALPCSAPHRSPPPGRCVHRSGVPVIAPGRPRPENNGFH